MGIADGIDRLRRTLRPGTSAPVPSTAAPVTRVSDPPAGPRATTSANGREPAPGASASTPKAARPSSEPPAEEKVIDEPVAPSADTLTGALTARVEEAYQSHREAAMTEEPAEDAAAGAHDDTADALLLTEPVAESPEQAEPASLAEPADALPLTEPEAESPEQAEPASLGEPAVPDNPSELDIVVLPPVIEETDAIVGEAALGREPPALLATPVALHADALARLEAAASVAESLGLGFHLGGAVERIAFGASQGRDGVDALREATWLIERYIALVEQRPIGADLHASAVRLGRTGDAIAEIRALTAALDASRDRRLAALAHPDTDAVDGAEEGHPSGRLPASAEPAPAASAPPDRPAPEPARDSFGREIALMAVRWAIMVVAVVAVVLAVTLIGEWV